MEGLEIYEVIKGLEVYEGVEILGRWGAQESAVHYAMMSFEGPAPVERVWNQKWVDFVPIMYVGSQTLTKEADHPIRSYTVNDLNHGRVQY